MSAKRFGGAHSPGGDPRPATERPDVGRRISGGAAAGPSVQKSMTIRAWILFVLPTPLLFAILGAIGNGEAIRLIMVLAAYAALMLGAWMCREGLKAEAAYDAREIAKAPVFPRKIAAAALAGVGVFLTAWLAKEAGGLLEAGGQLIQSLIFGALAVGAHIVCFGIDPLKNKGVADSGLHQAELDRVTDALDKAEAKLQEIERLAGSVRDREIQDKVGALNAEVRDMISIIEKDPRDLSRARMYLSVYLKGAEDATRKYAEGHERLNDPALRDEYVALLSDLEGSFSRGKEKLLIDDRTDLEVEIEVLRERLGQEGA